jgi:hypothetical protein
MSLDGIHQFDPVCSTSGSAAATASDPSISNVSKGVSGMRDNLSFQKCSERVAEEMRRLVTAAAKPVSPGESIQAQMNKAHRHLGRPSFWRVRAAWYGEAGTWSAAAIEEFRERYRSFRARQESAGKAEAARLVAELIRTVEALRAVDEDFHSDTIAALQRAIHEAGVSDRAMADARRR